MLKTLMILRLRGLKDAMFNRRRGKQTTGKGMTVLLALLVVYCVAVFLGMFGLVFASIRAPFSALGMGWVYYALAGILVTMLCFVGSIFFTQSIIFEAKDNEMLLSMPISPAVILASRMAVLLLINYAYAAVILLPCGVVIGWLEGVTAGGVVRFIVASLLLPLLPTALSCVGGWLIAMATSRMRNKNVITILLSLLLMGAYFAFCFNAQNYIERLMRNGAAIGTAIERALPPFYAMGLALENGDGLQLLHLAAWCVLPFALVYALLSRSYIGIVTSKRGTRSVRYRQGRVRVLGVRQAVMRKELRHVIDNANYLLNACMGAILSVALAAVTLIKGDSLLSMITMSYAPGVDLSGYMMPVACAMECFMLSMCLVSAPSVSLEGKNLWLLQSIPIAAGDILMGKAYAHMAICLPASVVSSLMFMLALPMSAAEAIAMLVLPAALVCLMAMLGVAINLRFPRFDFVNDTAVVKSSMSTMLAMLLGMGLVLLMGFGYGFAVAYGCNGIALLYGFAALLLLGSAALYRYLTRHAQERFDRLNQQ